MIKEKQIELPDTLQGIYDQELSKKKKDERKKSRINPEYLFISLLFILLSQGYKLGVFNTVFFVITCYLLLSVSHFLYMLLRKLWRFVYKRFFRNIVDNIKSFIRR